jgi:hypothetical protein
MAKKRQGGGREDISPKQTKRFRFEQEKCGPGIHQTTTIPNASVKPGSISFTSSEPKQANSSRKVSISYLPHATVSSSCGIEASLTQHKNIWSLRAKH